ncbi:AMP-binding protein [Amorphus sp. 3PC139-8]|uniref:AMP-binding protein n=1 Tax=Amorphus sp. 3PC139-8 TaxID=2735676 RepID=UPI00345C6A7A
MTAWPLFDGPAIVEQVEAEPLATWLRGETIPAIVAKAAEEAGGGLAHRFLDVPDGAPVDRSFDELFAETARMAGAFSSLGGRPVVASLLPGLPETLPLIFAASWAGVILPINPFLEASAIADMLRRTGARVLLAEGPSGKQGTWEKLADIHAAMPELEVIICGESEGPDRLEPWLDAHAAPPPPMPAADEIAAYFHTGGTTGLPKIARLSHANLAYMAFLAGFGGDMRAGDVIPCGMPLFHVGGLVFGGLAPVAARATVVQLGRGGFRDRAMLDAFWRIAEREGATILFAPPTVAAAALETFAPPAPANVRHWVSSAAPLPAATHRRFTKATGIAIKEAWGLTEASLVLTFTPPGGESRPGSVGLRLPYCELKIRSLSDPVREAAPGEPGVVMGRSPGLFAGYLGHADDGLTEAPALGPGRWLDTGDVGYFDADGYLVLTGRAKDMILRGGHNIDPVVIEEAFGALDEVAAVAAVGRPDARVGELPVVYVTLSPGAQATPDDLLRRASGAIAERAAHPKEVIIVEAMPLTAVGKINKLSLRHQAALSAVRSLYPEVTDIAVRAGADGRIRVALTPCPDGAADAVAALGLELDIPADERRI